MKKVKKTIKVNVSEIDSIFNEIRELFAKT